MTLNMHKIGFGRTLSFRALIAAITSANVRNLQNKHMHVHYCIAGRIRPHRTNESL